MVGNLNHFFGKVHTVETRQKMAQAKLGKTLTKEHKNNITRSAKHGASCHLWKGGVSKQPMYQKKINQLRRFRMRAAGNLKLNTIHLLYNINKDVYGKITCEYCKLPLETSNITIDHKTPLCRGGNNEITNLAIACHSCNSKKHTKTYAEFIISTRKESIYGNSSC